MKIAVLGASGFLGHNLVKRLADDGHEIVAVDIVVPDTSWRMEAIDEARVFKQLDLRIPENAIKAVKSCEQVYHLAADVGGVGYLNDNNDYRPWFNNARMTMNVLDACEKEGIDKMFFASSSCAYPTNLQTHEKIELLTEDLVDTGPADFMYGREKLMGALLCERAPLDARVGYINSAYGKGIGLVGEKMKYPASVTMKILRYRDIKWPVEIWGDGTQRRSYIYADDVVEKMITIMDKPYQGPVNITTTPSISCNDVLEIASELLNIKPKIKYIDGPTGVMNREVSNRKWEDIYGTDDTPPFEKRFPEFVKWMEGVYNEGYARRNSRGIARRPAAAKIA